MFNFYLIWIISTSVIKKMEAKSVVIFCNPTNYNSLKFAIVYFENEDVLIDTTQFEYNIKGNLLYWLHLDEKACHICGAPDHIAKNCDKE